VTWLVSTNIEGSSRIKSQSAERYSELIDRYQDLAAEVCGSHGGTVLDTIDDSAVMAVPTASAAFDIALAIVAANPSLAHDPRPVPLIRIGIDAQVSEEWASRFIPAIRQTTLGVCLAANGGQVLVSEAAIEAGFASDLPSEAYVEDLGEHRLASLARPYRLYQLAHPDLPHDFPPLRVLDNRPNNLPDQVTDFVGRQREIADVVNTLRSSRLCTITGLPVSARPDWPCRSARGCWTDFPTASGWPISQRRLVLYMSQGPSPTHSPSSRVAPELLPHRIGPSPEPLWQALSRTSPMPIRCWYSTTASTSWRQRLSWFATCFATARHCEYL
jgi:hypothetical protein